MERMPTVTELINEIKKNKTPEALKVAERLESSILKDEEIKLIEELAESEDWLIRTINIGRKDKYKVKIGKTINDLNDEQLKELLPKIDLYIEQFRNIIIDEFWIIKYLCLIQRIEEKLNY